MVLQAAQNLEKHRATAMQLQQAEKQRRKRLRKEEGLKKETNIKPEETDKERAKEKENGSQKAQRKKGFERLQIPTAGQEAKGTTFITN